MFLVITCVDNGLSPIQGWATDWTNADLLWIESMESHFSEIWTEMQIFCF